MIETGNDIEQVGQQEQPPKLSVKDFAAKIKAKYPDYRNVKDDELVQKIIAKYPDYKEQVDFSEKKNPSVNASTTSANILSKPSEVFGFDKFAQPDNTPSPEEKGLYPNADPKKYETKLSPQDEGKFQQWLDGNYKQGKIQKGDYDFYKKNGYGYDYDFRAAFQTGQKPEINKQDGKWHWNDIGKKPNEPTFSDQSKYNGVDGMKGGTWDGDNFIHPIDLPDTKQLALSQTSAKDNTANKSVEQSLVSEDEKIHHEENVQRRKDYAEKVKVATPKAIDNAARKSLAIKGIKPTVAQLNAEKQKFQKEVESGNATVGFTKEGEAGLVDNPGFWSTFHDHMMSAIEDNKNAREFAKMTVPERVAFVKKQQEKQSAYIGEKPNYYGEIGGAVPNLMLYGAGAATGGVIEAAAPETGGLSNLAMKPVMTFVMNAGGGANAKGMEGTLSRYAEIKKHNPEMSDEEAMTKASSTEEIDRLAGIAETALFSKVGNELKLGKSTTGNFLKGMHKAGLDMAKTTAGVEGLRGIGHQAAGDGKSAEDIISDMADTFKSSYVTGAELHGFMGLVSNVAKAPALIRSALKYDVVTKMPPEEVQAAMEKNVQSGAITPEQADKAMSELTEFGQTLRKLPDGLSDEAQAAATGLIIHRDNITKAAEGKDKSAQELVKQQTDAIDSQLKEIYRTGKPLQHEINPTTGETFEQPKFDDVQKQRVENVADKISKGKRLEDAEDIQAEQQFPDEVKKQLEKIQKEEAPKEDETQSDTYKNVTKYLKKNEVKISDEESAELADTRAKEITANKISDNEKEAAEIPNTETQASTSNESVDKNIEPAEENESAVTVIQPEDNKPPNIVEPPKEPDESNIHVEHPKTILTHKGLQEIATEIGGEDVTPRERESRLRQLKEADNEISDWQEKGTYTKNINDIIGRAKEGKIDEIEQKILANHLATLREERSGITDQDSKAFKDNTAEIATVLDAAKTMRSKAGGLLGDKAFGTSIPKDYASEEAVQESVEHVTGEPVNAKQAKKIKELTAENARLKKEAEGLEKKTVEETDKNIGNSKENKTFANTAKNVANKFRKLKAKPMTFKDEHGNNIPVDIQGVSWNDLVELGAKAIEKTGEIADGIAAIVDKVKDTAWYKGLSDNDKTAFAQKVDDHFSGSAKEKTKASNLEDLQAQFVDKKDNKFSPDEAKSIWDYAKKNYLDKGVSYRDMISQVKNDLGLSWKQVSNALTSPKLKPISDAMWKKQYDYRKNQIATKNWVEAQSKRLPLKFIRKVSAAVRGVAVFGHGGIFIGTHAGMTLFSPSQWKHVIPAFIRGWKFAYGNKANYARRIEELKNSPNYVIAQRAGLKNNPDVVNAEEFQKSQKFFEKIGGEAGTKGFNAIKVLRQDLFDDHYNRLSAAEKADPEAAASVAILVNLATGATNLKIPEAINEITFAGGMEAARWGKLTRSPVRATGTALKALFTPDKASVGDKVFAKVWARRVGEQLGTMASLLLANAAIQSALNPKNPTNLTDPNKQDYLKFKFGDITIDPTSGMRGAAMFAYGVGKIPFMDKKQLRGDTRMQALGKNAIGYGRGKLAPLYSTLADFFAQQDFNRNPLPFSDDKPAEGHHKLTWLEYGFEKAPLPIAHAAQDMYHSALDNGGDKMTVNHILDGIVSGALSGGTGLRVGEYDAEAEGHKHKPFTDEELKAPVFKTFVDAGLSMPNTSLSSEEITDEDAGTKKKVSDYPKDIQDRYKKEHNQAFKEELTSITEGKSVFVKNFTDKDGKNASEVYIDQPESGQYKIVDIEKLSKEEKAQVLSIAQKEATKKAKEKVFGGKEKDY